VRIALCLHGLSSESNDKGNPVSFKKSHRYLQQNVLFNRNVDIFFHTWGTSQDKKKELIKIYNPCSFIFEKQIIFDSDRTVPDSHRHSCKSRWYSHMKSVELKRKYEKQNNFKYDFILVARFDLCILTPFEWEEYSSKYFYSGLWPDGDPDGFQDLWFMAGTDIMDQYSNLYEYIDKYSALGCSTSSHMLAKFHAIQLGMSDRLRYIKTEKIDFHLERWHKK